MKRPKQNVLAKEATLSIDGHIPRQPLRSLLVRPMSPVGVIASRFGLRGTRHKNITLC